MIKNKLDFKLINTAILMFIFFLLYLTSKFWWHFFLVVIKCVAPFVIAFAIAHALYPLLKTMERKSIPKAIGVGIIILLLIGFVSLIFMSVLPLLFDQLLDLFSAIITFIKDISTHYDLDLGTLQKSLSNTFDSIVNGIGKYISDGAVSIINKSFAYISSLIIISFVSIYFLVDMDKIRNKVRSYLKSVNKKTFSYIKILDHEMSQYFSGLGQIMAWQFLEYTIIYLLIGHPNYLLIGVLASLTTIVPYLGAIATNILALITAFTISYKLFILTLIAILFASAIDNYLISPKVFGKTNKIPPLLTIFAVFAGGVIAGVYGVILALPVVIIIISTFKFYKKEIYEKVDSVVNNEENKKH